MWKTSKHTTQDVTKLCLFFKCLLDYFTAQHTTASKPPSALIVSTPCSAVC